MLGPRELNVLDIVESSQDLRAYFFRKAKGLRWFDELKRRRSFSPEGNPRPVENPPGRFSVPYWPQLSYLKNTADELRNPENTRYVDDYLRILTEVTTAACLVGNDNTTTWHEFAAILGKIPPKLLSPTNVALANAWLTSRFDTSHVAHELGAESFGAFLSSGLRPQALVLLECLTRLQPSDDTSRYFRQARFRYSTWQAERIFERHSRAIGEQLQGDGLDLLVRRLRDAVDQAADDSSSYVWRPAIEEHEQNTAGSEDAIHVLIGAVRESCHGLASVNEAEFSTFLSRFIASDSQIVRRIGLHLVGEYHARVPHILDAILTADYLRDEYRHEMFSILRRSYPGLAAISRRRILRAIESLDAADSESAEIRNAREAYLRLTWLIAIENSGDPEAIAAAARYRLGVSEPPSNPEFSVFVTSGWAKNAPDENAVNLAALSPSDVIDLLEATSGDVPEGRARSRVAAEDLTAAIRARSRAYFGEVDSLATLPVRYCLAAIDGFRSSLERDDDVGWNAAIRLCELVLLREDIWDRSKTEFPAYGDDPRWVTTSIARMCRDALLENDLKPPEDCIRRIEDVLRTIRERDSGSTALGANEPLNDAINSAYGIAIEGLFAAGRRHANRTQSAPDQGREGLVSLLHEVEDNLQKGFLETWAVCGVNIRFLLFCSREWIERNFERLFPATNRQQWIAAMDGYSYVTRVDRVIYDLMHVGGHFEAALDEPRFRQSVRHKVIQNIVIAYLNSWDSLIEDDGLPRRLLLRGNDDEIRHFVWVIWSFREHEVEAIRPKAIDFWRDALTLDSVQPRSRSSLGLLAAFLEHLDEDAMRLLLKVAPLVGDRDSVPFIHELSRLSSDAPLRAIQVFLAMLDSGCPSYPQEEVEILLKRAWTAGIDGRDFVERVISEYVRAEQYWVVQVHEELKANS